jgi:hypothetical protein
MRKRGVYIFVFLALIMVTHVAMADDDERRPPRCTGHSCNDGGDVDADIDVDVNTPVDINAPVTVETPVTVDNPVNVNTQTTITRNMQRQVPDAYFAYTPNFIDCGRVLGFQFGNKSGIASLGIPLPRDSACDMWKAVNEAQENGHILLSYAFMCEIKNIKKVWGLSRCQEITDTTGDWWVATLQGDHAAAGAVVANFVPPDRAQIATVQHSEIEEELAQTKEQVAELEAERRQQQTEHAEVQYKIDKYEKRESQRQEALDEFLKELEARKQNE